MELVGGKNEMELEQKMEYNLWCKPNGNDVGIEGYIVSKREGDVLKITVCMMENCIWRGTDECHIGKEIEGRWVTLN